MVVMKRVDLDLTRRIINGMAHDCSTKSDIENIQWMIHELRLLREVPLYVNFAREPRKSCSYCLAGKSPHHPVEHYPGCPVKALEEME